MNVLVLIKQVPAKSVPMDSKNGILDRTKAGGRMNPFDYYAIEAGLKIAEKTNGTVTALTMGPKSAVSVLKEAISMGCHEAVLLTDKVFSGADVYGTSYTIAEGIKVLGKFDAVICGQQTTDGDTAQMPFSVAEKLDIAGIGWVKEILEINEDNVTVLQELSFGTQKVSCKVPFLMAVGEGIGKVRIPNLRDQLRAKKKNIKELTLDDLSNKNKDCYGLAVSPTRVLKIIEIDQGFKSPPLKITSKDASNKIKNIIKEDA